MSRLVNRGLYGRNTYPLQGYKLVYQGGNPFYNYSGFLGEAADVASSSAKIGKQFADWLKANPEMAQMGTEAAAGVFQRVKGVFSKEGEAIPPTVELPPEEGTPTWMWVAGGVGVVALLGLGAWALSRRQT